MPKTSDIKLGGKLMILGKGRPGTRKTTAFASFPGPMYVFDCDGRIHPIRAQYPNRTDIEYDTYTAADFAKFRTKCEQLQMNNPYKSIHFASLTSIADMILNYTLGFRGEREKSKSKGVIPLTEIEDFGAEAQALIQLIEIMRVLNKSAHVTMEAHVVQVESKDLKGNVTTTRDLLTGGKKIAAKIPAYFNEVWHFEAEPNIVIGKDADYTIITQNTGTDYAKTSLPLPAKFNNVPNLFDKLRDMLKPYGIELD